MHADSSTLKTATSQLYRYFTVGHYDRNGAFYGILIKSEIARAIKRPFEDPIVREVFLHLWDCGCIASVRFAGDEDKATYKPEPRFYYVAGKFEFA